MNATGSNKPTTSENPLHECKCTKEDKTDEYEAIISELRNTLKRQNNHIVELQEKAKGKDGTLVILNERIANNNEEYRNTLADLQLDYDSFKNDYYRLREENNKLQNQTHKDGEIIENQKYQLGQYAKEIEELQEEIQALKVFALKYLAVR